jgi:uncharacterized protein (UPF0261 family)
MAAPFCKGQAALRVAGEREHAPHARGRQGLRPIFVVGTADTKGEELAFLADRIRALGGDAVIVDVGTREPTIYPDITAAEVLERGLGRETAPDIRKITDRGEAVAVMTEAFAKYTRVSRPISGIVGIGGGGGTSIVTAAMRRMPIGIPKLMVSTLASGDTAPFVGISDIVMMPAITDIAGLNRISRMVLDQAARAIVGMSAQVAEPPGDKPAVGLTMFGVTTPAVTRIAKLLDEEIEPIIFHATGAGGKTMESLVRAGLITAAIDITTTEVADLLFGGVLPAGEDRFDCFARTKVPWVGSVGACDMINFWAPETMPEKYKDRLIYRHNANVTLMRTTPEENRAIGAWIAGKLNTCEGPVRLLIPEKGVSMLDIEGGAFWDPAADAALFEAIETTLADKSRITRLPLHINDPAFAEAAVAAFREIVR